MVDSLHPEGKVKVKDTSSQRRKTNVDRCRIKSLNQLTPRWHLQDELAVRIWCKFIRMFGRLEIVWNVTIYLFIYLFTYLLIYLFIYICPLPA